MAMPELGYLYVTQHPGICGGRPTIRGTRISIEDVAFRHRRGESVDEILEAWPHLTPAQVYDAIAYYYDHQAEIDESVALMLDEAYWQRLYPGGKRNTDVDSKP
jgi:uncharacterized protein (DUF433 family)